MTSVTTSSETQFTYKYNQKGIRYKKTVGSVTTNYYLEGSTVLAESRNDGTKIIYRHDENGNYVGFILNGVDYYYIYNAQGDVVALVDTYGAVAAKYYYDAWGKLIKVTNASGVTITSSTHVGNINPIRYRGYYYDVETGLYYLQSRYYDPTVGRFINADGILSEATTSVDGKNLYAYCDNDPVNHCDTSGYGKIWNWIKSAAQQVGNFIKNTFGVQIKATTVEFDAKQGTRSLNQTLPIHWEGGVKETKTTTIGANKPVTGYMNIGSGNKAGIRISNSSFTSDVGVSKNSFSSRAAVKIDSVDYSFQSTQTLTNIELTFSSSTVKNGITKETYFSVGVNKLTLAFCAVTCGEAAAYMYSIVPIIESVVTS